MDCIAIKDIRPGLKNINVVFIVLEVGNATLTKENREVRTFKVADQTAAINVSIWGEPGNLLVPGDIVRLTKGYSVIWRQCLTLYSGKNGEIHKVGDFCLIFNEQLNMSEPNPNFGPAQPAAGPQHALNNGLINNGGNALNGGNNTNSPGPLQWGQQPVPVTPSGSGGIANNPSSKGFNGNNNNPGPPTSNPPPTITPKTSSTRLSNENKGSSAKSGGRGARVANSRNVK